MRQKFCSALCLCALLLVLLPVTASANSLPRPYLTIRCDGENPPVAWIALLSPETPDEPPADFPPALADALPDGWFVWAYEMALNDGPEHPYYRASFFGSDLPETFRVAFGSADHAATVTEAATRTRSMQMFTVDTQTGAITTTPIWVGLLLQFACTCSITLVIEAVVLLLFRFSWRENWKAFLLINLATQIVMTATFGRELVSSGGYSAFLLAFLVEAAIFLAEASACAYLLHGYGRARRVAYALTANLVSFVIGILCISPVYNAISALM